MATRDFIGNSVSVGTGIKVYFFIKGEYIDTTDTTLKDTGVALEVGIVNDIYFQTNRDVSPQYIAGNRNAISFVSGKRLTTGKISFAVIDRDFIDHFVNDLLQKDELKNLTDTNVFNTNRFGEITDVSDSTNFINSKTIEYLDQLPPVDIVLLGSGDLINSMAQVSNFTTSGLSSGTDTITTVDREIFQIGDNFQFDAIYKLTLEGVKFQNDNFGISAGEAISDQVLDFIVCGAKIPWTLVE